MVDRTQVSPGFTSIVALETSLALNLYEMSQDAVLLGTPAASKAFPVDCAIVQPRWKDLM